MNRSSTIQLLYSFAPNLYGGNLINYTTGNWVHSIFEGYEIFKDLNPQNRMNASMAQGIRPQSCNHKVLGSNPAGYRGHFRLGVPWSFGSVGRVVGALHKFAIKKTTTSLRFN